MKPIYHIVKRTDWERAKAAGEYRAASLDSEGFIHASYADQLIGSANKHYRGVSDLILLVIDPVSATLWIGAFAAAAGWMVVRNSDDIRALRLSGAVALTLAVVATVHTGLAVTGRSHLGVVWAKGNQQTGTLFER